MTDASDLEVAANCLRAGNPIDARRLCRRILAAPNPSAEPLADLADLAVGVDQCDLAVSLYRRAVALRPAMAPRVLDVAYRFAQSGRFPEAVGTLHGMLRSAPPSAQAQELMFALLGDASVGFFRFLLTLGIDFILDIGANSGQFARLVRTMGYEGNIVSVEPIKAAFERLQEAAADDSAWLVEHVAIGRAREERIMHVAANGAASSSLLPMLPRHLQAAPQAAIVGTEMVTVDTLEALLARHRARGRRALLKIDTQGYEKEVLEGARHLDEVHMLYIEVSTVPLYEGQCSMPELLSFVYERGFVMADVERHMFDPQTRQLLQLNATFVRESG